MGPGAREHGGTVLTQGTAEEIKSNPNSLISPFLSGAEPALSGGEAGGQIIAVGTPEQISESEDSITGKYLLEVIHKPI